MAAMFDYMCAGAVQASAAKEYRANTMTLAYSAISLQSSTAN